MAISKISGITEPEDLEERTRRPKTKINRIQKGTTSLENKLGTSSCKQSAPITRLLLYRIALGGVL
jgi:hypothetical protein